MWIALVAPLLVTSDSGPLSDALLAADAPDTLRAAFTVEITAGDAFRVYRFDPREPERSRWSLLKEQGENSEIDDIGAAWGAEAAPDGRLFPDDLGSSFSGTVQADVFDTAWRVRIVHRPTFHEDPLDVWAAQHLESSAWLDSQSGHFLRLDHTLPRPVTGPRGVRVMRYNQSYFLERDPEFGVSFITAISIDLEARAGFRMVQRAYEVRILSAELFFASIADETAFLEARGKSVQGGG
ncbi:MAG: hypothetical protein AAFQ22_00190 [Pseudomonadota bacterium]